MQDANELGEEESGVTINISVERTNVIDCEVASTCAASVAEELDAPMPVGLKLDFGGDAAPTLTPSHEGATSPPLGPRRSGGAGTGGVLLLSGVTPALNVSRPLRRGDLPRSTL